MNSGIIIAEYQDTDKEEVTTFFRKIFSEMGWTEVAGDGLENPGEYFYSQEGKLLVAKTQGHIIGTSGLLPLGSVDILLKRFYIAESFRGNGIAQKLLQETVNKAKLMGFKKIVLDVSKNNTRAIRFYEKAGFFMCSVPAYMLWFESQHPESYYYYSKDV